MREGSLPPFSLGFSLRGLLRKRLGRLVSWLRPGPIRHSLQGAAPSLDDRAAAALDKHEKTHAALLERSARLAEKAGRLEEAGTPSESVRNRADRARKEAEAELAALRASFVDAAGKGASRAFHRQLQSRYPNLSLPHAGGRPRR